MAGAARMRPAPAAEDPCLTLMVPASTAPLDRTGRVARCRAAAPRAPRPMLWRWRDNGRGATIGRRGAARGSRHPGSPPLARASASLTTTTVPFQDRAFPLRGCPCWNCHFGPPDTRRGAAASIEPAWLTGRSRFGEWWGAPTAMGSGLGQRGGYGGVKVALAQAGFRRTLLPSAHVPRWRHGAGGRRYSPGTGPEAAG